MRRRIRIQRHGTGWGHAGLIQGPDGGDWRKSRPPLPPVNGDAL